MSAQESRKVVTRAVIDESFRERLFSEPDAALARYDLTRTEVKALKALPVETVTEFASQLETRISISVLVFAAEAFGGEATGGYVVMGGEATGSEAYSGELYGGEAAGGSYDAYGGEAAGVDASGAEAAGGVVMGAEAYSGDAYGGEAAGGEAAGGEALGGGEFGGEGGALQETPTWLERLEAALGLRNSGNAPRGINYY